ncbi:MAG: hypothetical protein QXF76_02335 [Candidatus Anstonellales archaeon]
MQRNVFEKKEELPKALEQKNDNKVITARISINQNKINQNKITNSYLKIIKIIDNSPFNIELFSRIKKELGNVKINEVNTGTNNYRQIKIRIDKEKQIDLGLEINKENNSRSKVIFANLGEIKQ